LENSNGRSTSTRQRRDGAPQRSPFPTHWSLDLPDHPADYPEACLVYIRRTTQTGSVSVLGHDFPVDDQWVGRLVRCQVLLSEHRIHFFRLRRRDPQDQPLLNEITYELPRRPFQE